MYFLSVSSAMPSDASAGFRRTFISYNNEPNCSQALPKIFLSLSLASGVHSFEFWNIRIHISCFSHYF